MLDRKQILSDLIGIGIFMSGERTSFKDHPITPEAAIVNAVTIAKSDRLILQLRSDRSLAISTLKSSVFQLLSLQWSQIKR